LVFCPFFSFFNFFLQTQNLFFHTFFLFPITFFLFSLLQTQHLNKSGKETFVALMKWTKHDIDNRKCFFNSLFRLLRLKTLPQKVLKQLSADEVRGRFAAMFLI